MSVSALSRHSFFPMQNSTGGAQLQTDFQELGQDLQSGNLSQAQTDFASLTQAFASLQQSKSSGSATTQNPLASDFGTLGKALQSGNTSAAQQAYSAVQGDMQHIMAQRHHFHHSGGSNGADAQATSDPLVAALTQIGQALKSGTTSAAQQAYSAIQGQMAEFAWSGSGSTASALSTSGVNLLA